LIDPSVEKAYLGSFEALICAADATNSLNTDNPFRKALEGKFGSPASAFTEYEQLKAQIDDLEASINKQKKEAVTVKEAKTARDASNQLPTLKALLAASDKKSILSLTWDYEKGNNKRPFASATISKANPGRLSKVGGCPIKTDQGSRYPDPYGFSFDVRGSKGILELGTSVDAKNAARQKEKVQNAPPPKF